MIARKIVSYRAINILIPVYFCCCHPSAIGGWYFWNSFLLYLNFISQLTWNIFYTNQLKYTMKESQGGQIPFNLIFMISN